MSPVEVEHAGRGVHPHTSTQESTILALFPEIDIQSTELQRRGDQARRIAHTDALAPRARHRLADAVLVRIARGATGRERARGDHVAPSQALKRTQACHASSVTAAPRFAFPSTTSAAVVPAND